MLQAHHSTVKLLPTEQVSKCPDISSGLTEFQKLVRHIGTIIWNTCHSASAVRSINRSVDRACWEKGEILYN